MSDRQLINLYRLVERTEVSPELRELAKTVLNVADLNHLIEIRVDALEKTSRVKVAREVIDGREISAIIAGKRVEST